MTFECYDKIIGLSESDCECTATDRPADYNESKSGLFLDELSSVSSLVGLAECDSDVWGILEKARAGAIKQFVADTNALLGSKYRLKRKPVSGQVLGQIKHKDTYSPDKNYAQVTLSCSPVRGGFMRLLRLGGTFTQAGTISVQLHNNVDGLLDTYTITTVANKLATTPLLDLQLPLYSKYMQPLEYYLVYLFDVANPPKATELDCGCGNWTPQFNRDRPYYKSVGAHTKAPWSDYVMVGGREINSLTELDDESNLMSNNMYGLSVEVDFGCKVDEVLCEDALDFIGNPLALSMALAIQNLAGVKVANAILKSPLLTRENMIGGDEWEESAMEWQEKYNENVNYIVAQTDHTANDCLACKDVFGLTRKGLFS